jgi:hypothetical protein
MGAGNAIAINLRLEYPISGNKKKETAGARLFFFIH